MKRFRIVLLAVSLAAFFGASLNAQEEQQLTVEQQREFLMAAKVISYKQTAKGITNPFRLTLSDGRITHDALFQSINERKPSLQFPDGHTELNFVDSYLYNIAAYELSKLVGLDHMMPVTVARKWGGRTGAISWWLPVMMDESDRTRKKVAPPDGEKWNEQMHKLRVFAELVYDTDRNLGNVLIDKDWKIYMIDYTRAFRLYHDIKAPDNLLRCSRELFENLKKLDKESLTQATGQWLKKPEIEGVLRRRDKIVTLFEKLAAQKGEKEVFY